MNEIKKVLITGASGGIGSSICKKFINNNFKLVLTSSAENNIEKLKNTFGNEHFYYKVDLSNSENVKECFEQISKDHKDISVVNLNSNYQIIKALLPNMLSKKYGKIIGISSIVGSTGNAGQANYVASKSGMVGLYKSIALEVSKRNINVNIVSPGFILTSMTDNLNAEQKEIYLSKIPMSKFGKPEDIANVVFFLASDDSSYITGQNIHVNGGMLMF